MEELLKDLHRLHLVTKDFKHIIEYEPGSWKMFEPSNFVYSYFAFNTFYNFDWKTTVKTGNVSNFARIYIDGKEQDPSERTKFKSLVDFLFEHLTAEDEEAFFSILKGRNRHDKPHINDRLIKCMIGITPDRMISDSDRDKFKKEFKNLIETENLQKSKLKNEIIGFIYQVRNNIFHGTKTTIEMTDRDQRFRLEIYSKILIAINEILFRVLSRLLKISFDNKYRINFND